MVVRASLKLLVDDPLSVEVELFCVAGVVVSPKLLEDCSDERSLVCPKLLDELDNEVVDLDGPKLEDDSVGGGLSRVVGVAESVRVCVK